MQKMLVSIPDAAEAIGQGRTSVYELIRANKLETVFAGRRRLVVVESLQAYVASLRAAA
jgi:excisionase family DNA binding protein